jgi:putative peptidoglycan lipid II flippase
MYAYRLQQLPIGIFAYSIGLVVFPTLTEAINSNQLSIFRESFSFALRNIMFITIPIPIGMIVLAEPLISVVFQHGAFTYQDTIATIPSLIFFAIGIVEQAALVVLPRAFYALQDTWTPVLLSGISLIVNIVLMNVLVKPLAQGGLALAISISGIINMLLLLYFLRRRIGFIYGKQMLASLSKILLSSIIMGVVVWLVFHVISTGEGANFWHSLFNLAICTCIGLVIYLILAVMLRMREIRLVLNIFRHKNNR